MASHDSDDEIAFYDIKKAYGELSNFFKTAQPLKYKNKTYPTSEHLYQSLKFDYPGANEASLEYAEKIRIASTPYKAYLLANFVTAARWQWMKPICEMVKGV